MRTLLGLFTVCVGVLAASADQVNPSAGRVISGVVERVSDGDGIVVDGIKIRLFGIDAFENKRPRGPEAKRFLKDLVEGKKVSCVIQGIDVKDGQRPYAQCTDEAGHDLSCAVAWQGFAVEWKSFSKGKYAPCDRITPMQQSKPPGPAPF